MQITIIQQKIYDVKGQKIMLDFDLAQLYSVETKVLNQSVKRNAERFPSSFMFRLRTGEWKLLQKQMIVAQTHNWSQFVTGSQKHRGKRTTPFAFTEH